MQAFIFWIGTIVTKYILDEIFIIELMKEIAKEGYYLSNPKVDNISKKIKKTDDNIETKIDAIIPFIPIVNIIDSMQFILFKNEILNQLDTMNLVTKMTEEERKEYEKKPTLLTIYKITIGLIREKEFLSNDVEYKKEDKEFEQKNKNKKCDDEIDKLHEIMDKYLKGEIDIEDLNNLSYIEKKYVLEEAKKQLEEEIKNRKHKVKNKK